MIKISVIVPIYNVERYLPRCIESVRNQKLADIEIILVDDGSPDACPQMCDDYARADNRIKVVHKKNEGLGYARNSGLQYATGEYVTFLDSDDYVSKDMYEKVYQALKSTKSDCCVTGYIVKKDSGEEVIKYNPLGNSVYENDEIIRKVLAGMLGSLPEQKRDTVIGMSVWKCVYSRDVIVDNRISFPSEREFISEDIIFQIKTIPHTKRVCTLSEGLYYYCENKNSQSLTKTYSRNKFDRYKKLYKKELDMLTDLGFYEETKMRVARMFLGNTRVCVKQICASKEISKSEKKELLRVICNDDDFQKVLTWYPWKRNPIKQKVIIALLKLNYVQIIIWLISIIMGGE